MAGKRRKWQVRNKTGDLLHKELTEKVIKLCLEAHRQYGGGQKESLYRNSLEEKLNANKIPYKKEEYMAIISEDTGKTIGSHRLDFVIDSKVIIELKSVKFTPKKFEQQLFTYLKNSPYEVGLIINFGSGKLYIRRLILTK